MNKTEYNNIRKKSQKEYEELLKKCKLDNNNPLILSEKKEIYNKSLSLDDILNQ